MAAPFSGIRRCGGIASHVGVTGEPPVSRNVHDRLFKMKTALTILITAAVTWIAVSFFHGVRTGTERLWLISAIKVPGRMAISEIQADMNAGRFDLAKAKLQAFADTWQRFDRGPDSFGGLGIGDVMVSLGAAEKSQPQVADQGPSADALRRLDKVLSDDIQAQKQRLATLSEDARDLLTQADTKSIDAAVEGAYPKILQIQDLQQLKEIKSRELKAIRTELKYYQELIVNQPPTNRLREAK